jgi:hypothetical protein
MSIETLGEAWSAGWRIYVRCLDDGGEGLKRRKPCSYRAELEMQTLVCTRGRDFPIARIAERLRCPRCGCRRVSVMFRPPATPLVNAAAVSRRAP